MKVVNINLPQSMRSLTTGELKEFAFNVIAGRAGRDILAEILAERYDTKRKVNMVVNRIPQIDLTNFYCDLKMASATIDFGRSYLVTVEPLRGILALKQG